MRLAGRLPYGRLATHGDPARRARLTMTRKQAHLAVELLVNLALPWLCYRLAEPRWGEYVGLLASGIPPIAWSFVEFLRLRRVDALSLIVLAGIALSLGATLLGGDARLLLVRESLISGAIGLVFLLSLLMARPLLYDLARAMLAREGAERADAFEALWQHSLLRHVIRVMTGVWGLGLCGEAALRTWLAWHWSPERFLAVAPVVSYGVMGALFVWTLWYRRRLAAVRQVPGDAGSRS